ncbi:Aste57867_176 [Aphanomyces stellatus]|uniref:Aste57867_176 protein n=1 Tax=Aphanomyces stellatus TaxID=120398 RepID=A0A485K360_9STRA|nr:hypothetical protein As57867_000176 [Aphanomyces stellatus]VFT77402.1 Aste57867_176 [Aphanomyces stellatus]
MTGMNSNMPKWVMATCFVLLFQASILYADAPSYNVLQSIKEGTSKLNVVRSSVEFGPGTSISLLFLLSGQSIIGGQFEAPEYHDQAIFPGFAIMQAALYLDRPLKRAVQVGLGVGTVPTFLRQHGVPTDVVEISEGVVTLAEAHFGYERCVQAKEECINGKTYVMDGLMYLRSKTPLKPSYDLVIIDVYTGYNVVPFYTDEIMWLLKESWLKPQGVVVLNFVGYYNGPHMDLVRAIHATLLSVYQYVRCFRELPYNDKEEPANLVFYASSAPITFTLPTGGMYDNPAGYYEVITKFQEWEMLHPPSQLPIEVTVGHDEYSPELEFHDLKDVQDPSLVLKTTSDFVQYKPTLDATESYMKDYCVKQFPRAMWTELGFAS